MEVGWILKSELGWVYRRRQHIAIQLCRGYYGLLISHRIIFAIHGCGEPSEAGADAALLSSTIC